jgi:pimeloyl-ACP methyl ester carboxylesterase
VVEVVRVVAFVGFVFIALVLAACARNAERPVTVPDGARAGDLVLEACTLGSGDAAVEAECGTLVVPENRSDPNSRLIALPLAVVRSQSGASNPPLFGLGGGPGSSNVQGRPPAWMNADRDVVNLGYRGVDGSVVLDMPRLRRALRGVEGDLLGSASIANIADAMTQDFEATRAEGIDLAGYTIPEVVADLDAARAALGYETIDLFSASYGTRVAQFYAYAHPARVRRSLMVAVNPPGRMVWEPAMLDAQLEHVAELCALDADCSARTDNLAQTIRNVVDNMPRRYLFLPIDPGRVRLAAFSLISVTPPSFAAAAYDAFIAAEDGDASGLAALSLFYALPPFDLTRASNWGDLLAKGLADFDPERDYLSEMDPTDAILGSPHSLLFFGAAQLEPPGLPPLPDELLAPQISEVDTLLVGGSVDLSTPASYATDELLPFLPNGEQVILEAYGHLDYYGPAEAFERLVVSFLDTGEADVSLYPTRTFTFTPNPSFRTLGKLVVVAVVAIPLLIVLLVWLIVRLVRRRRRRRTAQM